MLHQVSRCLNWDLLLSFPIPLMDLDDHRLRCFCVYATGGCFANAPPPPPPPPPPPLLHTPSNLGNNEAIKQLHIAASMRGSHANYH